MSEKVYVNLVRENLMVGRALRARGGTNEPLGEWHGMYLYEGKLYLIDITANRFNGARDQLRDFYRKRNAVYIQLGGHMHGHVLPNWDIYGAEDGWRVEFKFDRKTDTLTYTQPGKSSHDTEADAVEVLEPTIEPTPAVELPLDPALSAPDDDFPLTMGASHHKSVESVVEYLKEQGPDPLAAEAEKFPAYWKPLPRHWRAVDTYRVDVLFPLNDSRLTHARKKLLVCGTRTGGKSIRKDIAEAYATLGQWLAENPED